MSMFETAHNSTYTHATTLLESPFSQEAQLVARQEQLVNMGAQDGVADPAVNARSSYGRRQNTRTRHLHR